MNRFLAILFLLRQALSLNQQILDQLHVSVILKAINSQYFENIRFISLTMYPTVESKEHPTYFQAQINIETEDELIYSLPFSLSSDAYYVWTDGLVILTHDLLINEVLPTDMELFFDSDKPTFVFSDYRKQRLLKLNGQNPVPLDQFIYSRDSMFSVATDVPWAHLTLVFDPAQPYPATITGDEPHAILLESLGLTA